MKFYSTEDNPFPYTTKKEKDINDSIKEYKKFIVFKREKNNDLKFVEIINEGNMHEGYDWIQNLNRLSYLLKEEKKDLLFFEFNESNPDLILNYVEKVERQVNSEYFKDIIKS